MTLKEALQQLEALGNDKMRAHNIRYGAGADQFGVKHGDIRMLAKSWPRLCGRLGTPTLSSWPSS